MAQGECSTDSLQQKLVDSVKFALQLIREPATTFRNMARHGGFIEPLLFMATVGLIAGIFKVLVTFYYMANGASVPLLTALSSVIIVPITVITYGYIGAFLLSIIMKYLGCDSNLETAFRVCAYLSVISPIAVIALAIPYVGNFLILGILAYLLVTAAVEVYQLNSNTAAMVFGIGFAVLALLAGVTEYRNRDQATPSMAPVAIESPASLQQH
ncbi:MAG: YIP1 family protein [Desulfuromonas sp.]|nr:YIP1 family protein [Desulfuromonas sp.]